MARDIAIRIEPRGTQNANGDHFGAAPRRASRDRFAAQIGQRRNPAARRRDKVRVVRVQDGKARGGNSAALERAAAGNRVRERVG